MCTWNIEAPSGNRVELKFEAFVLEYQTSCGFDWLEVYDGKSDRDPKIGNKLCGSGTPSNIVSRGSRLFLKFRSDGSKTYSGFKITYNMKGKIPFKRQTNAVT